MTAQRSPAGSTASSVLMTGFSPVSQQENQSSTNEISLWVAKNLIFLLNSGSNVFSAWLTRQHTLNQSAWLKFRTSFAAAAQTEKQRVEAIMGEESVTAVCALKLASHGVDKFFRGLVSLEYDADGQMVLTLSENFNLLLESNATLHQYITAAKPKLTPLADKWAESMAGRTWSLVERILDCQDFISAGFEPRFALRLDVLAIGRRKLANLKRNFSQPFQALFDNAYDPRKDAATLLNGVQPDPISCYMIAVIEENKNLLYYFLKLNPDISIFLEKNLCIVEAAAKIWHQAATINSSASAAALAASSMAEVLDQHSGDAATYDDTLESGRPLKRGRV